MNLTISMPEGCTREQAVALADEALQRIAAVDNVETVGAMMSSASGAGSMDMTSMMTAGGGEYDVTAYITLPEGASGAEAGKQMEPPAPAWTAPSPPPGPWTPICPTSPAAASP